MYVCCGCAFVCVFACVVHIIFEGNTSSRCGYVRLCVCVCSMRLFFSMHSISSEMRGGLASKCISHLWACCSSNKNVLRLLFTNPPFLYICCITLATTVASPESQRQHLYTTMLPARVACAQVSPPPDIQVPQQGPEHARWKPDASCMR